MLLSSIMSIFHRQRLGPLIPPIVGILSLVGIFSLQVPQLRELTTAEPIGDQEKLELELETTRLSLNLIRQMPAFGFQNLIADWTYLGFVQYFGDKPARVATGYGLSPEYFEVILDRDPYFRWAYLFLSSSTTLYAGLPERTIELMDRKLPLLQPKVPDGAYYIWRYKAIDELLFLGDAEAARQSFLSAADWASEYSDAESENIEQVSRRTAEFLAKDPESKAAQISAWTMVLNNSLDDTTQKIAIDRIESLGGQVTVDAQGRTLVRMPREE